MDLDFLGRFPASSLHLEIIQVLVSQRLSGFSHGKFRFFADDAVPFASNVSLLAQGGGPSGGKVEGIELNLLD